jgi:hypothetical protein
MLKKWWLNLLWNLGWWLHDVADWIKRPAEDAIWERMIERDKQKGE